MRSELANDPLAKGRVCGRVLTRGSGMVDRQRIRSLIVGYQSALQRSSQESDLRLRLPTLVAIKLAQARNQSAMRLWNGDSMSKQHRHSGVMP